MQRLDYKVVQLSQDSAVGEQELSRLGAEEWDLVAVVPVTLFVSVGQLLDGVERMVQKPVNQFIFKRPARYIPDKFTELD